ncbi:MAG TPA: YdcF family protein [Acidiferrobacter sp.]|nr:YdcF family protein [Acidiferrobacter sp.]
MIIWHGLVNACLTPPGLFVLPMGVGLALIRVRPGPGLALVALAWAGLLLVSLPITATTLARDWEVYPALTTPLPKGPRAIVVLAAGRYRRAPEYGGHDTVAANTLVRLRYAARLYRESRLPILVSGGAPLGGHPAAVLMRHVLRHDLNTPVKWVEGRSHTTGQNATRAYAILAPLGIRHVFLVTQALHMRRAVMLFRHAGFTVTPAPTDFATRRFRDRTVLAFLPSGHAMALSALVFHEMIGVLWVRASSILPRPLVRLVNHG